MKKSLLALLVLVSSQGAFARSILSSTLTYDVYKIGSHKVIHSLDVYADGSVVDRDYTRMTRAGAHWTVVAHLTSDQMARLDRLVRRSQPEILRFERTFAKCIVAATTHQRYTAVNSTVQLRDGDMCDGGFNVNVRPAARKLVNVLDVLHAAAHRGTNMAEVESNVEAMLNAH